METVFTPWQSLAGGLLIGLSATLLMLSNGRILGATGIFGGLFFPEDRADWSWRFALLLGAATGPIAMLMISGQLPEIQATVPGWALAAGGVIVGLGATLGSGCTSGHGVCGMARLSPRSILATLTFMASTGLTVFVVRHAMGG